MTPKNNFIIIINSLDLLSWNGSNIYNCNYYINLSSVLDYNYKFEKNYKITFSFKGNRSIVLVSDVVGIYLNNISYFPIALRSPIVKSIVLYDRLSISTEL